MQDVSNPAKETTPSLVASICFDCLLESWTRDEQPTSRNYCIFDNSSTVRVRSPGRHAGREAL